MKQRVSRAKKGHIWIANVASLTGGHVRWCARCGAAQQRYSSGPLTGPYWTPKVWYCPSENAMESAQLLGVIAVCPLPQSTPKGSTD